MSDGTNRPRFVWISVIVIMGVLITYNLYSGLVAHEIGVPGVLDVKFGPKGGMASESNVSEMVMMNYGGGSRIWRSRSD